MTEKYLVINADDFGYSDERNNGIIHCFRKSCITSASLLINGVKCEEAVFLAKKHGLSTGLHVNLTEGTPVGGVYKTLTGDDGYFRGKFGLRDAISDVSKEEIRCEIQAQVDKFTQLMGRPPFHADGHQHIHTIPEIAEIFASVLESNNIKVSRIPVENNMGELSDFLLTVVEQSKEAASVFSSHNIWFPQRFLGTKLMGSLMKVDAVRSQMLEIFENQNGSSSDHDMMTCEWMVHPGYITRSDGGCGSGADDFASSPAREHEMKILCCGQIKKLYSDLNVKLADFEGLYELVKSEK